MNGDALDVTKWIPIHPGGEQVGTLWFFSPAGDDLAEIFHGFSKVFQDFGEDLLHNSARFGSTTMISWDFSLLKNRSIEDFE